MLSMMIDEIGNRRGRKKEGGCIRAVRNKAKPGLNPLFILKAHEKLRRTPGKNHPTWDTDHDFSQVRYRYEV
jgi:hypothetical protein